jgi:hypothetical protein
MYRREVRQSRLGDLLILFGINPRTCRQCPLKSQCLADGSKGSGGRRITVIRKKLPSAPLEVQPLAQPHRVLELPVTPQPPSPVLWLDFPATRLRRDLTHQLRQHQIVIEPAWVTLALPTWKPPLMTRDQRAHRRLTWAERWNRNASTDAVPHWQVKLFGICSAVLDWPGFGDSDRLRLNYGPALYHQFLQDFVQAQFTQPIAVVAAGHAAGYAVQLASQGAWSRLVLAAPTWHGPLAVMGAPAGVRRGVRGLVRSHLLGPLLYGLNTRPAFLKWMYRRHVFTDETKLTPEYIEQRYQTTQQAGARYAPAAFVTGGLDPVETREQFLTLLQKVAVPIQIVVAEQAPPYSKAEMEAMIELPQVTAVRLPGTLGMAEEYGPEVAAAILPFLTDASA